MLRLYGCIHCQDSIYTEYDILNKNDLCHSCDSTNVNRWLCMYPTCGYIGCGQKSHDHSNKHFQTTEHPIVINLYNHKLYCNACQKQLQSVDASKPTSSQANGYVKTMSDPIYNANDDLNYEERPLGLVGLKNLGNTCYMNAALQCLLNIPQMTEYFETTHPSFFDNKNYTLTRHYQNLVNEIFGYKSKTYVIPTGVCHTMKAIYPPFRGYMQQDSQEFLRVFMDKMHNETKVVSKYPVSDQLSIESGDYTITNNNIKQKKVSHSIISDIFQGKLSNSIKCLQCERISYNEDYFEDLSLPIANNSKASNITHRWWPWLTKPPKTVMKTTNAKNATTLLTTNVAFDLLYYQLSWIFAFFIWIKNWFTSQTVTLEQCLELFFSQDELKGDNKYSCDMCKGHQNAIMQSKLVKSPEILCFHLKRFRNDFGFSKITTAVRFPIDGLDMNPYLHRSHTDTVHLYDLIGIICHYGSGGGGHYTAYVLSWRSQSWFEFDDDQVSEVDVNVVMSLTSCAYVLFYKKRDDEMIPIREYADKLLKTTIADSAFRYYINRSWVVRFNTFAEPGPINNFEFLCHHGAILPEKYQLIHETTIEVSQKTWAYLINKFGGGPTCTSLHVCSHCDNQRKIILLRRDYENTTFAKLHKTFECTNPKRDVHVLSLRWFRKWEDFTKGFEDDPPGSIDNSDVVYLNQSNSKYILNTNSDYGWISMDTWEFFHGIYGGGPVYNMCPSMKYVHQEDLPVDNGDNCINDDDATEVIGSKGDNNDAM